MPLSVNLMTILMMNSVEIFIGLAPLNCLGLNVFETSESSLQP